MKIVLLDLETAPLLGWVWGKYDQNVNDFEKGTYILCAAYKWLDERQTHVIALPDFPRYKRHKEDDRDLVKALWKVLDEADIVIAHNGDSFDLPRMNTRFLQHHLKPPSPYKTIDTLKIARSKFGFISNKLDDLGRDLGLGRKVHHTGFHLWRACMQGDLKAWKVMKRYNKQDVILLERIYKALRPWVKQPLEYDETCTHCGSQRIIKRGFNLSKGIKRHKYQCKDCGGWSSDRKGERISNPLGSL